MPIIHHCVQYLETTHVWSYSFWKFDQSEPFYSNVYINSKHLLSMTIKNIGFDIKNIYIKSTTQRYMVFMPILLPSVN